MNQTIQYLTENNYYHTFDLGLACALFCLGHVLCAVEKSYGSKKAQFIFNRDKGLDQTIERYWNGQLEIDARTYFDSIRTIKNRLYSS